MGFNLILLQMLSSDPRIFLAQANANDGKQELQTFGLTKEGGGKWLRIEKPRNPRKMGNQRPRFMKKRYSWSIRVHSWFSLPLRTRGRAQAPSTHFPLLPPRNGRPLQSVHALFPPLFSLLPILDAHCKVSTHFSLPSSPFSLPNIKLCEFRTQVCRSPPSFLFFGIIRGVRPVHCAGKRVTLHDSHIEGKSRCRAAGESDYLAEEPGA